MCRLLGVADPAGTRIADVLGSDRQRVFQDMARLHDDGWGHAWLGSDGAVHAQRFVESGLQHPGLGAALSTQTEVAHLVHLRFASSGLACTLQNTHPFTGDGMAFAHNGSLLPPTRLDCLIRGSVPVAGSTDSERYFAVIRSLLREGNTLQDATLGAVREIRDIFPRSSLNAILLTPDSLVAVHASRNAPSPWRELRARVPGIVLPEAHDERYFTMHIKRTPSGAVAIASSGMDVSDWSELPDESVTVIALDSLEHSTVSLD